MTATTSESSNASSNKAIEAGEVTKNRKGMNYWLASFFVIGHMTGAGFLALPNAVAGIGWAGLALLIFFGCCAMYSDMKLGMCWVILEERWAEYKLPARQPYMEIASRAYGKFGNIACRAGVLCNLIGSCIVYIILVAQFLSSLVPQLSFCETVLIVGAVLIPLVLPATPKDFWPFSVLSVFVTIVASLVIIVQLTIDESSLPVPEYNPPTFQSFSLAFGAMLFSFGGASTLPTIQNDLKDRTEFWKSLIIAFLCLLLIYIPVSTTGYYILGSAVPANILLYGGDKLSIAIKCAIFCDMMHVLITFTIAFSPVCQSLEDIVGIPRKFCWQRCAIRCSLVLLEVIIALSIPNFGLIINLVGGSAITLTCFVFPPLFYIKLCHNSANNKNWPQRSVTIKEKIILYGIVTIGVVGGICASGSAILGLVTTAFSSSCWTQMIHVPTHLNSTAFH